MLWHMLYDPSERPFIFKGLQFIIFDLTVTKLIHSLWAVKTLAVKCKFINYRMSFLLHCLYLATTTYIYYLSLLFLHFFYSSDLLLLRHHHWVLLSGVKNYWLISLKIWLVLFNELKCNLIGAITIFIKNVGNLIFKFAPLWL